MPYQPTYDLDFLIGKFDPSEHPDFVVIDQEYSDRSDRMMHKTAYEEFQRMADAARMEGISLKIISAVRNFDYQNSIWDRKWSGQTTLSNGVKGPDIVDSVERARTIMLYSAMPGTSRHHWGTDVDINALNNAYFESGKGLKQFTWLEDNAAQYGFYRPYTSKEVSDRTGYEEEKWHWSYLPLAKIMTEDMKHLFENEMLKGFAGCEQAEDLDVKRNYILGIDDKCLP